MIHEDIVFFSGNNSGEAFAVLDEGGPAVALDYLSQWHYPGEHETTSLECPWGTASQVYRSGGYVLAYNRAIGAIGLYFEVGE